MDNKQGIYKIYCLTNMVTGMKYVGMTRRNLKARFGSNGRNYEKCTAIWNAIKEYGWKSFSEEVLADGLTYEQACKKEKEFIAILNTRTPNGYNLEGGGTTGKDVSPLVKAMMVERNIRWRNDPEHKAFLSRKNSGAGNPNYGKKTSEETKEKMRQAKLGKKHTPEAIQKMKENHTHYHDEFHPGARAVMQFSLDGEYIKTYPCVKAAQEEIGCSSIYSCLSKKTYKTAGYIWQYAGETKGERYERVQR